MSRVRVYSQINLRNALETSSHTSVKLIVEVYVISMIYGITTPRAGLEAGFSLGRDEIDILYMVTVNTISTNSVFGRRTPRGPSETTVYSLNMIATQSTDCTGLTDDRLKSVILFLFCLCQVIMLFTVV